MQISFLLPCQTQHQPDHPSRTPPPPLPPPPLPLQFPGAAPRSIEDIKGRYYSIARQLVVGREGGPETAANQTLVRHPYDPRAERERKKGLELLLARSQQQVGLSCLFSRRSLRFWGGGILLCVPIMGNEELVQVVPPRKQCSNLTVRK